MTNCPLSSYPALRLWLGRTGASAVGRSYIIGLWRRNSNHEISRKVTVTISREVDTELESFEPGASRSVERT